MNTEKLMIKVKDLERSIPSLRVYDISIIDYWQGLIPLEDYIKNIQDHNYDGSSTEKQLTELKHFVLECFSTCLISKTFWEIDVNNGIYVGALPDPNIFSTRLFLAFKQSNNGQTFLVSPFDLSYLKKNLCRPRPEQYSGAPTDSKELLERYIKVVNLVEALFSKK